MLDESSPPGFPAPLPVTQNNVAVRDHLSFGKQNGHSAECMNEACVKTIDPGASTTGAAKKPGIYGHVTQRCSEKQETTVFTVVCNRGWLIGCVNAIHRSLVYKRRVPMLPLLQPFDEAADIE